MVSEASSPRTPRDARAPRAGRSGRTRAGNGCPGSRTASPGRSSTPSASTSSAAQSSIRTPGTVSRGKPTEPAPRADPREPVRPVLEEARRAGSRFAAMIPRERASTALAGTQRDDREDLRRRRRADRRVVLERGDPGEQVAVAGRQPADPEAGHRVRLRHHPERDPRSGARRRPPAGGPPRRTRGRGRPRRGAGCAPASAAIATRPS